MGLLNKATDTAPYMRLKTKIDELKSDPRYQFMFSGMLVADSMGAFIAKIFRLPARGKPISIIDVSGVPSDIVSVVVAVLARLVFDYAIWSRSEVQRPVLLVCEEAHRYIPSDKTSTGQAVRKILERIAKEGRKYGVSLGLITQRPSDLAEGVLSQCGTIIAMRLNNDRDQQYVKNAMPEGSRGFLDVIPALAQPRMHRLRRGRLDPDPGLVRRSRARPLPGLLRPALLAPLEADRRGRSDGRPRRQALARAGAVRGLFTSRQLDLRKGRCRRLSHSVRVERSRDTPSSEVEIERSETGPRLRSAGSSTRSGRTGFEGSGYD